MSSASTDATVSKFGSPRSPTSCMSTGSVFNAGVNCIQHSVLFQIKHEGYNPDLITTMLLLLPFSTFITIYVVQNSAA